ncbi:HAMP domain-containing sensor histidine kinase [Polynucleobacter sp. P1-05-14]|uniref:sensor histidine kinase n=1 Tax=Polynucleobacter sp. P1-05-14 TaxID=1819732 RepID=UPI001C0B4C69|nr:HAMP domain-containing sensor histidine kinase [Polynucleobacter sp. P1-05-14]MBU3548803.1 HAMP domain-containing histidine kinase [Polynucleobacter sp. P1-05-14]
MQNILSADFYLFGLILLGSFICSYSFLVAEKPIPNLIKFWAASALFAIAQYLISGFATQYATSSFNFGLKAFAFSNIFHITSVVFQTLFCYSLLTTFPRKKVAIVSLSLILFGAQFVAIHQLGYISLAAFEVALLMPAFQALQILFLVKYRKKDKSTQLNLLVVFTSVQLILACIRLAAVSWRAIGSDASELVINFDEIPLAYIVIATVNMFFNVLSYQAMVGYWAERAIHSKIQVGSENSRILQLLSERDQLINSLSRANKTAITGALSASLAHELNQPLGAIKLGIQLLKTLFDKSATSPMAEQVMQDIENENQRATDLIKTLRSIFVDGGIEKKQILLDDLIRSVGMLYKTKFLEDRIQIQYFLAASIPINGNSLELHQVIVNLMNNSIDAFESSKTLAPTLVIQTTQNDQYLYLSISDNGPGVPEAQVREMFELIKTSNKKEGMGLGLWLVKFIIERHGGTISYKRSQYGGAQFDITLPMISNG